MILDRIITTIMDYGKSLLNNNIVIFGSGKGGSLPILRSHKWAINP